MFKLSIFVNFFVFLLLKCSFIYGQGICPPNEVPSECQDSCNRCETDIACPAVCFPGCQCLPGYTRDFDSTCIPRQLCPGFGESSDSLYREPYVDDSLGGRGLLANRGGCPNPQLCILSCRRRLFKTGVCLGPGREYCNCYSNLSGGNQNPPVPDPTKNVGLPSGGISPRYLNPPPPPAVAPYPPALPLPPRLPLVPKPPYSPALPIPPRLPLVPKPPYSPVLPIPPKLPLVPKPPYVPGLIPKPPVGKPPLVPPPPVLPPGDCPNIVKCIVKCQGKGSSSGFCTGINRSTCQCI